MTCILVLKKILFLKLAFERIKTCESLLNLYLLVINDIKVYVNIAITQLAKIRV